MSDVVLLDAGPLGMVSHPRATVEIVDSGDRGQWRSWAVEIVTWLARLIASGVEVLIPEIADYEVRRELLRVGSTRGIERLNELQTTLGFVPITSAAMRQASAFWADARRRGRPTADDVSLDADVILAAQAATLADKDVVIASTNPRHISRFVPAEHWQDITG